ncbi:MAG TPA: hypothetical protein VG101_08245 [Puia sp.]|jgi:hypothetical protein|nr:hypothetical protein [Puia sp.]
MAKKEKNTIDMPEVSDIPGQEHIRAPRLGELADETASSADEEGDDILGPLDGRDDGELRMGGRSNVTPEERADLASAGRDDGGEDEETLRTGLLDSTDDDGTPLNEKSFGEGRNDDLSADDLDVPGADDDDRDEASGDEDEENNDYSISKNDDDTDINTDL